MTLRLVRLFSLGIMVLLGQELLYTGWKDSSKGAGSYRSRIIDSVRLSKVVLALASDRRSSGRGLLSAQAGSSLFLALPKRPVGAA